jgi:hypothetical protein
MKIRPVGAQLFHADRQKDRPNNEANSRFCNLARSLKRSAGLVFVKRWSAAIFSAGRANNNLDIKLKEVLLYIWQLLGYSCSVYFSNKAVKLDHSFLTFFDVEIADWWGILQESSDLAHSTEKWITCRLLRHRYFVLKMFHACCITQSVYRLDDRGIVVRFPEGTRDFLFSKAPPHALRPTQPSLQKSREYFFWM